MRLLTQESKLISAHLASLWRKLTKMRNFSSSFAMRLLSVIFIICSLTVVSSSATRAVRITSNTAEAEHSYKTDFYCMESDPLESRTTLTIQPPTSDDKALANTVVVSLHTIDKTLDTETLVAKALVRRQVQHGHQQAQQLQACKFLNVTDDAVLPKDFVTDYNFGGMDIRNFAITDTKRQLQICYEACLVESGCKTMTLGDELVPVHANRCYLKTGIPDTITYHSNLHTYGLKLLQETTQSARYYISCECGSEGCAKIFIEFEAQCKSAGVRLCDVTAISGPETFDTTFTYPNM